jgi:hypothetical protein
MGAWDAKRACAAAQGPDESLKVPLKPLPGDNGEVYFLKLRLTDSSNKEISSNFYWLSAAGDEKADFTALYKLPKVNVNYSILSMKIDKGKSALG